MLTLPRFKGTLITTVVVLLICVVGICTVDAVRPKSGSTDDVAWYIYVYDVRLLTDRMDTNSSHYFKVRRRGSKNVSGTWEFAHKIREGVGNRIRSCGAGKRRWHGWSYFPNCTENNSV